MIVTNKKAQLTKEVRRVQYRMKHIYRVRIKSEEDEKYI